MLGRPAAARAAAAPRHGGAVGLSPQKTRSRRSVICVTVRRYLVTEAVFESPRYGQRPRDIPSVTPIPATGPDLGPRPQGAVEGEHDLLGDGWVEIDDGELRVAIRPHGLVGHLEPKETRAYPLPQAGRWHTSGDVVEVSFGDATYPSHLGRFRCSDAEAAQELTAAAHAAGVHASQPPRHSGI